MRIKMALRESMSLENVLSARLFTVSPLWQFHGGWGCAHIAGRAPCDQMRGVAFYGSGNVHLVCSKIPASTGMNAEYAVKSIRV